MAVMPLHSNLHHLDVYLNKRGLSREDLAGMGGVQIVEPHDHMFYRSHRFGQAAALSRVGVVLTYLDPTGKPYLETFEAGGEAIPYELIRYLTPPLGVPVGTETRKINSQWGRRSQLHFQPLETGEAWGALPDGAVILHTESMIKAIVTSKYLGLPSIGYNGVNGFSSSKVGMELIHQYVDFDFKRYTNVILFDSNVVGNEGVARARSSLCHRMRHILGCAVVKTADLPKPAEGQWPEPDWGPDDYLVTMGADALMKVIGDAQPYEDERYSDLVEKINEQAYWVKDLNCVLTRRDALLMNDGHAANQFAPINRVLPDKGPRVNRVLGYSEWKHSAHRQSVDRLQYRYLDEEVFEESDVVYANLYRKSGIWPAAGRAATLNTVGARRAMELFDFMLSEADLRMVRAYLKFLKYTKLKPTSYPVLWSPKRGVGKGWTVKFASELLGGTNVGHSTIDQLVGSSNDHVAGKRLVVLNEVSAKRENRAAITTFLKTFIGDDVMAVKKLYVGVYPLENRAGLMVTVNNREDMPSDGLEDRRQWYVECKGVIWGSEDSRWHELWGALRDREAMEELALWVEGGDDVDFTVWRPEITEQRMDDLMMGRHPVEALCLELKREFGDLGVRLCSMEQIRARAEEMGYDMAWYNPRTMGMYLKETGWIAYKEFARVGASKTQGWSPREVASRNVREIALAPSAEIKRSGELLLGKESKF